MSLHKDVVTFQFQASPWYHILKKQRRNDIVSLRMKVVTFQFQESPW